MTGDLTVLRPGLAGDLSQKRGVGLKLPDHLCSIEVWIECCVAIGRLTASQTVRQVPLQVIEPPGDRVQGILGRFRMLFSTAIEIMTQVSHKWLFALLIELYPQPNWVHTDQQLWNSIVELLTGIFPEGKANRINLLEALLNQSMPLQFEFLHRPLNPPSKFPA